MKYILFLFSIVLYNVEGQNLSFAWAKKYSGNSSQYGTLLAVDPTGNIYTAISFDGITDFDPGPGIYTLQPVSTNNIGICKLSAAGNLLWAKQIGAGTTMEPTGVAVDNSNNVYLTGRFDGSADFDPGIGVAILTSGADDAFILKLTTNGNYVWGKHFTGQAFESSSAITIDVNNNVITTGTFQWITDFDPGLGVATLTPVNFSDAFISKLDSGGNFVWVKQFVGADDVEGISITTDYAGNIYSTGTFIDSADFDPGSGIYMLGDTVGSMYVSKLDAAGNFVFAKRVDANPYKIILDGSGDIIIGGSFAYACDFDPGPLTYSLGSPGSDYFILKLNPSGNFLWVKASGSISNSYVTSVAVDLQNNIYANGTFFGTIDIDPGPSTYTVDAGAGTDIFISKLNPSGSFLWGGQMGGGSFPDNSRDIVVDNAGNLYSGGTFMSDTCELDPTAGSYTLTNSGMYDSEAYVNKLSYCIKNGITDNSLLSFCSGGSTTLNVTSTGNITWYSSPTSSIVIATGSILVTPTLTTGLYSFYAETSICLQNFDRTLIQVQVNPLPQPSAICSSSLLCINETATINLLGANSFTVNNLPSLATFTINLNQTTAYSIIGTYSTGCINTAVYTQSVNTCLGINDVSEVDNSMKIYPNPTSGQIKIIGDIGYLDGTLISIYDYLGREVLTTPLESEHSIIQLQNLNNGVYIITISKENTIRTGRIIVAKD